MAVLYLLGTTPAVDRDKSNYFGTKSFRDRSMESPYWSLLILGAPLLLRTPMHGREANKNISG